MKKQLIIVFFMFNSINALQAQEARVVVSNTPSGKTVQVKYYTPKVFFENGVNIYRRQQGQIEWVKVNETPLKKGSVRPATQFLNQDKELNMLVNLLDSASGDQLKGFVLLSVLVKSFQSEVFSYYLGILFDDVTTQEGLTYEYKVMRITRTAEEQAGISSPVIAGNYVKTSPPLDITGQVNEYKASFGWMPEPDRYFGVNVYRRQQSIAGEKLLTPRPVMISKINNQKGERGYADILFEDDSLEAGIYVYEFVALDFFGRESERSKSITLEVKDVTPPPAPEKLTNETDNIQKRVTLTWQEVSAADVAGYIIYRTTKNKGEWMRVNKQIVSPLVNRYTDQLDKAKPQYYTVAAIDKAGNESRSAVTFAQLKDVVPPVAPRGVVIKSDTGKISISWIKNSESDLLGYQIYRTVNSNKKGRYILLNSTPSTENSLEEKLPRNVRNNFIYTVVAVDSSYNKSEFSLTATVKLPDVTPPSKPFIKKVTPIENSLVVEWMAVTDTDTKLITVSREGNRQNKQIAQFAPSVTRFVDKQAEAGIDYEYFLTTTDSSGNDSEPSNRYSATLLKPKQMTTITEVKTSYDSLTKYVTVSWPTQSDVTGFVVYRKENKDEFRPLTGLIREVRFEDGAVRQGKTYAYRIKAFDAAGLKAESEEQHIEIK